MVISGYIHWKVFVIIHEKLSNVYHVSSVGIVTSPVNDTIQPMASLLALPSASQSIFLACGLVFIGLSIAIAGILSLRPALDSLRWPAVDGEVVAAAAGSGSSPYPGVRYRYTVAGKSYSGARRSFRDAIPFTGPPAPLRLQPGEAVRVYYDPIAPDRSVLEPGAGPLAYIPVAVGGLFFILGLLAGMLALF